MRSLSLFLIALAIPCLAAEEPVMTTLFDFEDGVSKWVANPWSGGKGFIEAVPDAKFGKGAMKVRYENVPQACNMISPYFADDAPWREGDYDSICLWLKGDGTQSYLNVILASEAHDLSPTYSGRVPLDSKQWRRFCLRFGTLWNREGTPFRLSQLKRMYFGCGGTHEAVIDQVGLQRSLRPVPLQALDNAGPAAMQPRLYADRIHNYFLTFDPQTVLEPTVSAALTVQWPEKKPKELMRSIPAESATEETWVQLPSVPDAEGQGRLKLRLTEPQGVLCYAGQFSFPVALGAARLQPTDLQLIPQPKLMLEHPTKLRLPRRLNAYIISQPQIAQVGLERVKADFAALCGCRVSYDRKAVQDLKPAVLVIAPNYERPRLPDEVTDRLRHLRPRGYVLHTDDTEIVLAALDEEGMRNGAITLRQAILSASPSAEEMTVPGLTVLDWPSLPVRAVNIGLPTARWGHPNDAPVPVDFFIDFLQRTVVDQKINMVGLEVLQGMKFDSHPEIAGPAAWSKQDVRRVVDFLRGNGVEVFPLVNSLGHANWLVIPMPKFREDGDENTLCTRHPEVRKVLEDVYNELIRVFEPKVFHFGLDEIRWKTFNVPADKRCARCAGLDKRDLFVEHVRWLNGFA
ncbi:MAG: beta-N-acetylhexosaminidase, partial [Armatimonadetes bacterium]|nr:beta-N-acetylhexosaminidase [Armatimonadota bacterium]